MGTKGRRSERAGVDGRARISEVKKILVPVDFSENAEGAVQCAGEFAAKLGANVYLLHVVEPPSFMSNLPNVPYTLSDEQLARKAGTDLEAIAVRFMPSISARAVVRRGKAHHEITKAAEELGVNLIVLSTHGYTGLKHTLLGSTAERVVRHAPCMVLVVR
jgi:nucleotide-binding universal stress UspA family protein